jgi:hypothetical protein
MHIVAIHDWPSAEAEVAKIIAEALGCVVFEARQKIAGGGPRVLASFSDPLQADALAAQLSLTGVPALAIDVDAMRSAQQLLHVRRFKLEALALRLEFFEGQRLDIDYGAVDLLLTATSGGERMQTTGTVTERKFSIGKTLLAGGIPMTKKVTREETTTTEERDETLWLYAKGQPAVIFTRGTLNFEGLGSAMQLSRDLNFAFVKKELRRMAPQARYDDRLLQRAGQARLLGPGLNPESHLDLACEILARTLRPQPVSNRDFF